VGRAFLWYTIFLASLFAGAALLPGQTHDGPPLADGTRRRYKLTGLTLFLAANAVVAVGTLVFGLSLAPLITHFGALATVATLYAVVIGIVLYRQGRAKGLDQSHDWPTMLRRASMGIELNPEWLGVDLKMFAYQPSLIGLWLLVLAFAYRQVEVTGRLTPQMGLFQVLWWVYLVTHYRREEFMLQTWDIIAENFGFALLWGDLVLVPFFYCIGGWALLEQTEPMSRAGLLVVGALFAFGLWLFRGSNDQKHRFKADPGARIWGQPAETVGGRLLVSGWWGIGRHLNYTGEIVVYTAIALCAGVHALGPFLLPLWLTALLSHRALRDERRCRAKYGDLWEQYCARARFRMFPLLY